MTTTEEPRKPYIVTHQASGEVAYVYDPRTLGRMAERLLQRIDTYWAKFEETGEPRYAELAADADRMYLRAKAMR